MKKKIIFTLLIVVVAVVLYKLYDNEKLSDKSEVSYMCPMKCEGEKYYSEKGKCPVCEMNLVVLDTIKTKRIERSDNEILETSVFNLTSKWTTQDSEVIELKELEGSIFVVTMIYTSCKSACPRLIADMRGIDKEVNDHTVKYVFISIDPEHDTAEVLNDFSKENQMEDERWVFLRGSYEDVQEFSNVVSMKYKRISPIDFSHSNIISVFDKKGVLYYQQEGLNTNNQTIVSKIRQLINQ